MSTPAASAPQAPAPPPTVTVRTAAAVAGVLPGQAVRTQAEALSCIDGRAAVGAAGSPCCS